MLFRSDGFPGIGGLNGCEVSDDYLINGSIAGFDGLSTKTLGASDAEFSVGAISLGFIKNPNSSKKV